MTDTIKILVVDDESMNLTVMKELLGEEFDIQCAEDSLSCIDILSSWVPDLVLMDVKMPGINGLDTCRQIKNNPETEFIPVIFVSALGLPDERIAGYEAGGDDYIVKPYNDKELVKKIHLSIENSRRLKEAKNNFQESMQAAMTAMNNTAEIGNILHFYQNSFTIDTYEEVISRLMSVISDYGLNAVIGVFTESGRIFESSSGIVRSIEIAVIEQIRKREGSIFNFGHRSAFSYGNITILVMNMPVEDEEKYGRLKDHIAMLAEGGNARVLALMAENEKNKHQASLQKLLEATTDGLQALEEQQSENQGELEIIMSLLSSEVEDCFFSLGLTDEQEKSLMEIIHRSENRAKALFDKDLALRRNLEAITASLSKGTAD